MTDEETDELAVAAEVLADARERMIAADAAVEEAGDVEDPVVRARIEQLLDASAAMFVVAESLILENARLRENLELTGQAVVALSGAKPEKPAKKRKKK